MAMTSLISLISYSTVILLVIIHLFLPSSSHSLNRKRLSDTFENLVVEEKTRLGSTPPSCHNKCNQCHPCMAVQVPTMPSHNRVQPSFVQSKPLYYFDSSPSSTGNRYSNYKPLGWKCRCDGHFYNP